MDNIVYQIKLEKERYEKIQAVRLHKGKRFPLRMLREKGVFLCAAMGKQTQAF